MQSSLLFEELKEKRIAIVGYGIEGKSTERFLRKLSPSSSISILDQSEDHHYLKRLNQSGEFDLAILTPSQKREDVLIPYTTATNIFFELVKGKVIAITGSKGKSTTTYLTYMMMKDLGKQIRVGNLTNVGSELNAPPILDLLYERNQLDDIYIIELSSYQLCDLHFSPHIAVITNIFPEHINWHGDYSAYQSAKKNIINFQKTQDWFFYKPSDPVLDYWAKQIKSTAVAIDLSEPIDINNNLLTKENKDNARLAREVARHFDVKEEMIDEAINSFKPLPNRLNNLGNFGGINFFDDGASSAPEATISALAALPETDTLMLGGQDRGYDFNELFKVLVKSNVRNLVLFPDTDIKINSIINSKYKNRFQIFVTRSMDEAVRFAFSHTEKDKICLLSPGAPSYSLWKNWHEKGLQYMAAIKKYANK